MEVALTYSLAFLLAWPLGAYMARVFGGNRIFFDPVFNPLEHMIYAALRAGVRVPGLLE